MAKNWHGGGMLVGGLLLGAAGAFALVGMGGDGERPEAVAPGAATAQQAAAATATPAVPPVSCSFSAIVAASGGEDGMLRIDKDLQGSTSGAVNTLILSGKEAAAAGRMRDAESAFLMACRSAETLTRDPVPLADAQYQLGRHYAQVGSLPATPKREEMLARAHRLYASALHAYRTHRGQAHEKTRFAQQGLEALRPLMGAPAPVAAAAPAPEDTVAAENTKVAGAAPQAPVTPAPAAAPPVAAKPPAPLPPAPPVATAPAPAPAPAPVPVPAPAAQAKPQPAPAVAMPAPAPAPKPKPEVQAPTPAAAPQPAPQPTQARKTSPSFDCARARSATEKLICDDEDLARQDRELGRMHARAKQAAGDPRAFQRDSDAEWQRREATCRDRECLQRWYAQRRAELGAANAARRPAPEPAPEAPRVVRRPRPDPEPVAAPAPETEILGGPPPTAAGDAGVPELEE